MVLPMSHALAPTRRHLTDEQVTTYRREGYLAVPGVIDGERVVELRRVTEEFVARSRRVARSDEVFDLDPRHTAASPALRRIKNPADNHAVYRWIAFESPIPDIVAELIGPDVRFHHSKLNLKGSHIGAQVEWHQDAAFYPHSNDDVLAVGLLLDDASAENGCLAVLPGSHRGPIHEHYDESGRFTGCMRPDDIARLDAEKGRLLALPAGSIHIHHYRLVHWSAPNTSPADRRLLINSYSAADAIPLVPDSTHSPQYGQMVRGRPARAVRRQAGEMRLPPDFSRGYTSIYELQTQGTGRGPQADSM
jgi:ectoine hydroxylase-related dioxygenase (phytanoyl-CoA dioxygenase family)